MYIGYTGSHGTGKSFSTLATASQLKLEHNDKRITVLMEVASESPFKINKGTTRESQLWIFTTQIQKELENLNMYDILISDRTCVDCIGYSLAAGFYVLAEAMVRVAKCHVYIYDKIIFKTIANNPYHFKDGIRSSDIKFRIDVEEAILIAYDMIGIKNKLIIE